MWIVYEGGLAGGCYDSGEELIMLLDFLSFGLYLQKSRALVPVKYFCLISSFQ